MGRIINTRAENMMVVYYALRTKSETVFDKQLGQRVKTGLNDKTSTDHQKWSTAILILVDRLSSSAN